MIQNWATYDWPVIRRGDAVLQIRWKAPTSTTDPTLIPVDLSAYSGRMHCEVWTHDETGIRLSKVGDATVVNVDLTIGRFNLVLGKALTTALPLTGPAFYDLLFDEPSPSTYDTYRLSGRITAIEGQSEP